MCQTNARWNQIFQYQSSNYSSNEDHWSASTLACALTLSKRSSLYFIISCILALHKSDATNDRLSSWMGAHCAHRLMYSQSDCATVQLIQMAASNAKCCLKFGMYSTRQWKMNNCKYNVWNNASMTRPDRWGRAQRRVGENGQRNANANSLSYQYRRSWNPNKTNIIRWVLGYLQVQTISCTVHTGQHLTFSNCHIVTFRSMSVWALCSNVFVCWDRAIHLNADSSKSKHSKMLWPYRNTSAYRFGIGGHWA